MSVTSAVLFLVSVSCSATSRTNDVIQVGSFRDRFYYLNVSIGTPPRPFSLVVDPNMQFTILAGYGLTDFADRHRFDWSESSTFQPFKGTVLADGAVGFDDVKLNDSAHHSLEVSNAELIVLNTTGMNERSAVNDLYRRMFLDQPLDGIFGLQSVLTGAKTPFSTFGLSLWKTCTNSTSSNGGALVHGALSGVNCGTFERIKTTTSFASCLSISFRVDEVMFGSTNDTSRWDVVLSMTPDIVLPASLFESFAFAYNATLVGDQYVVPCDADPGDLLLTIDGRVIALAYNDLIDKIGDKCVIHVRPTRGKEDTCESKHFEFALGLPFLRRVCLVMDVQNTVLWMSPSTTESRVCTYSALQTTSTASPETTTSIPVHHPAMSTTAIIVTAVVATLLLILICVLLWFFAKYRRRISQTDFILSVLSKQRSKRKSGNNYQNHSAIGDEWEVDQRKLIVCEDSKIGSGAFANVYKGRLRGPQRERIKGQTTSLYGTITEWIDVAVKISNDDFEDGNADMVREIEFMKHLGSHAHVLSMLGCVSIYTERAMLVVELCAAGDLLHWLRNHGKCLSQHSSERCDTHQASAIETEIYSVSWQIADGMVYLASRNLIHRDIASRNVLLTSDMIAKISDFGLCRRSSDNVYNTKSGKFKWMAPESLRIGEFTPMSDIWSFGVLLYELFTAATIPFGSVEPRDQLALLDSGERLPRPAQCPERMYQLMTRCWAADPSERPTAEHAKAELEHGIVQDSDVYGYLDLQEHDDV